MATSGLEAQPLSLSDFEFLEGQWQGELIYLDYRDDASRVTLPTFLRCELSKKGDALRLEYRYNEPDGSEVDGFELLRVPGEPKTLFFDGLWTVTAVERDGDSRLRVVLEREGRDNDREARLRKTIERDRDALLLRKEVRYQGAAEFLVRNEYQLSRSESR
jgi:hypothetical protein